MRFSMMILIFVLSYSLSYGEGVKKQFLGMWQPYSTTALSIIGPIQISNYYIDLMRSHDIVNTKYVGKVIIKNFYPRKDQYAYVYKLSNDEREIASHKNLYCKDAFSSFLYMSIYNKKFFIFVDDKFLSIRESRYFGCALYVYSK